MRSVVRLAIIRIWLVPKVIAVVGLALGLTLVLPSAVAAQQPPERVFGSEAGLVFNPINPGSTADFEMVIGRLREALQNSDNPVRNQQANGWKVFRAAEPGPGNSVLYIFVIDPAVADANYAISIILNEAFPAEVQELYEAFSGAYAAGQSIVNLDLVSEF